MLYNFLSLTPLIRSKCRTTKKSAQQGEFTVEWTEYQSSRSEHQTITLKRTLVIFPPTGGATPLDHLYAEQFCENYADQNHISLIVQSWTGDDDLSADFERHSRHFAKVVKAFELLSNHYSGPISLMGTSLGALYSLAILARFPQIDRATLITGGWPLVGILTHSEQSDLVRVKKLRMKRWNITQLSDYSKKLSESMAVWDDLSQLVKRRQHNEFHLCLVNGLRDQVVPTEFQTRLKEKLNPERLIEFKSNHFWSIVKAYLLTNKEILDFLSLELEVGHAKTFGLGRPESEL